jgi:lactoylglutathione lyase
MAEMPAALGLRFDHVHLRSPDAAAAADWYIRVLGAELVEHRQGPRPRYELRLGGLTLLINVILPGEDCGPAPASPHQGLEHLGFTVADIDATAAALLARGAVFQLPPTTIRGLRIAFVTGPDGVPIELLQAG